MAVEEEQRLQRLVLRGGAHLAVHREVGQELLDCGRAELARVSALVKSDVTPRPLQVRLLSAQRKVARAHPLARDREQAGHSVHGLSGLVEGRHGAHLRRWKQITVWESIGISEVFAAFRHRPLRSQAGRRDLRFVYNLALVARVRQHAIGALG